MSNSFRTYIFSFIPLAYLFINLIFNEDIIRGLDANQVGLLEQNPRGPDKPTLGMSHKAFRQAEVKYWDWDNNNDQNRDKDKGKDQKY